MAGLKYKPIIYLALEMDNLGLAVHILYNPLLPMSWHSFPPKGFLCRPNVKVCTSPVGKIQRLWMGSRLVQAVINTENILNG